VSNSKNLEDQYEGFIPKGEKFDLVRKVVAQNWYEDEFFCNELFNGCNPLSVYVVDHERIKIHEEFFHLKDSNGQPLVEQFPKGDLFVSKYTELRNYVWPNVDEEVTRICAVEPQILSAFTKEGKIMPLGIGFYFGKNGTDF
jgi:hypothetical protein